jgi:hypothetical protein
MLLLFGLILASVGCSPSGENDPVRLGDRCADVAEKFLSAGLGDLAEGILAEHAPRPDECGENLRARLFMAFCDVGRVDRAPPYLSGLSRDPKTAMQVQVIFDGMNLVQAGDLNLSRPRSFAERIDARDLEVVNLIGRNFALLGDSREAVDVFLRAAGMDPRGRVIHLRNALNYALRSHDGDVVARALDGIGPLPEILVDLADRCRKFTRLKPVEDISLRLPGPPDFRAAGIGESLYWKNESKKLYLVWKQPQSRPHLLLPLGDLDGSFTVSMTVIPRSLPFDATFYIGIHGGFPAWESPGQPKITEDYQKDPTLLGGWWFGAKFRNEEKQRSEDFFPEDHQSAGSYSTGSWRGVTMMGPPGSASPAEAEGAPRLPPVFEYGTSYRIRFSHQGPLQEIGLSFQETGSPYVTLERRGRISMPPGPKYLFLVPPAKMEVTEGRLSMIYMVFQDFEIRA